MTEPTTVAGVAAPLDQLVEAHPEAKYSASESVVTSHLREGREPKSVNSVLTAMAATLRRIGA
jgi:hypothetical protein